MGLPGREERRSRDCGLHGAETGRGAPRSDRGPQRWEAGSLGNVPLLSLWGAVGETHVVRWVQEAQVWPTVTKPHKMPGGTLEAFVKGRVGLGETLSSNGEAIRGIQRQSCAHAEGPMGTETVPRKILPPSPVHPSLCDKEDCPF